MLCQFYYYVIFFLECKNACVYACVWKRDTHTHRSIYSSYSQQLEWSINLANAHIHNINVNININMIYISVRISIYAYTEVWNFRENKLVFLEFSIACLPGPYSSGILPARWSSTKLHDDAKDQGEETKWRQFPPWTNLELIEKKINCTVHSVICNKHHPS